MRAQELLRRKNTQPGVRSENAVLVCNLMSATLKGLRRTYLFSSKKGNAHDLVHTLCYKTLNFCTSLQQCEKR